MQAAGRRFGAKSPQATVTILTQAIAKSICGTSQQHCTGANAQYTSPEECFGFLTGKIRFGQSYELGEGPLQSSSSGNTEANTWTRQKHPPLPHGAPEHGPLPPRRPLLAHRQNRRWILQRRQDVCANGHGELLHKQPICTVWVRRERASRRERCSYIVLKHGICFGESGQHGVIRWD